MFTRLLIAIVRSQRGATAVEYGLILALIVLAVVSAIGQFAGKTNGMWNNISNAVNSH